MPGAACVRLAVARTGRRAAIDAEPSRRAMAGSAAKLTLADLQKIAIHKNQNIAMLEKEIEKAQGEKQSASRFFSENPEFSGEVKNRKAPERNILDYSLSISQQVEIKGQRNYRIRIARLNLLKSRLLLKKEKLIVTEKVKVIFTDSTSLHQKLAAFKSLLEVENRQLQWRSLRAKAGEISSVDLNTVKLEALRTREKSLQVRQEISATKQQLRSLLNNSLPPGKEIDYRYPEFPGRAKLKGLAEQVARGNFEIKIAATDLKIAELNLQLIKSEVLLPAVNASFIYSREDEEELIGGAISFPLPVFNLKGGERREAAAEYEKAGIKLRQTRLKARSEISKYLDTLSLKEEQRRLYTQKIIPVRRESLDKVRTRYQNGEIEIGRAHV